LAPDVKVIERLKIEGVEQNLIVVTITDHAASSISLGKGLNKKK